MINLNHSVILIELGFAEYGTVVLTLVEPEWGGGGGGGVESDTGVFC